MVTGSHIPEDRNGIKFNTRNGEILKSDEEGIRKQTVDLPGGLFDEGGMFRRAEVLPPAGREVRHLYVRRYLDYFPLDCLAGLRIGVYQHSAVGRDDMMEILGGLGASVVPLGRSETFVPVDTEAIRPEDVEAARVWSRQHGLDAVVSTDGDSDRPLVSDENGKWLRGDVAGILCAAHLGIDTVVTPVSCNSALEQCGRFVSTIRTRIGSPYVIEGMDRALADGRGPVAGYEANGGFLLASPLEAGGRHLAALPTRDAIIVQLAILLEARARNTTVSGLVAGLPARFTWSDRLKEFPTAASNHRLARLREGGTGAIEAVFGGLFGPVAGTDDTDGLRITFDSGEVVHLRPSGNAPEFRCYNEADSEARAREMNHSCLELMAGWRGGGE
jgi:phosphomannomutase